MTALALILGSLVLLGPPAVGESTPADALNERLSLNIDGGRPADVFASFAQMLGVPLEMDSAVTDAVTIRLEKVSMSTALQAICESIECRWSLLSGPPLRLHVEPQPVPQAATKGSEPRPGSPLDEKMSIHLKEAALGDVLLSFGQILSARLEVDPSLPGRKLSIEMDRAPAREVLEKICALVRCTWTLSDEEPRVLTFVPIPSSP